MKKEFLIERQGKTFCLYAGVLDLCHQVGLKSVETTLIQVPGEANNRVAIVHARVTLLRDGQERVFDGIGDAAPNNCPPAMQVHLIRLAETRAKARAMRDAVNIGVVAFEELGEEGVQETAPQRGEPVSQARTKTVRQATTKRAEPIPAEMRNPTVNPLTDAQAEAILSLCRRRGLEPGTVVAEQFAGTSLRTLTQAQASEIIKSLNGRAGTAQ